MKQDFSRTIQSRNLCLLNLLSKLLNYHISSTHSDRLKKDLLYALMSQFCCTTRPLPWLQAKGRFTAAIKPETAEQNYITTRTTEPQQHLWPYHIISPTQNYLQLNGYIAWWCCSWLNSTNPTNPAFLDTFHFSSWRFVQVQVFVRWPLIIFFIKVCSKGEEGVRGGGPVDLKVEFSSNKTYRKLGGPGNFLEVQLFSFRVKMNDKVKKVPF